MKKRIILALFAATVFAFSACSSGDSSGNGNSQAVTISGSAEANSIDIAFPNRINKGAEGVISVIFEPANSNVSLSCDSDAIAFNHEPSKESDGKWVVFYTAKKNGIFTITAKSGGKSIAKSGNVCQELEEITLSPESISPLEIGQTLQLTASQSPSGANEVIVWESSDPEILSVDQNGKVTAKKAGKASISAAATFYDTGMLYDGKTTIATSTEIAVKGFFLSDSEFFLAQKKDGDVTATALGIEADNVTWTSSDPNIFTVTVDSSDSKKAKLQYVSGASGSATLTAKMGDYTANATVYVAKYSIIALGDSIAAGYAPKAFSNEDKSLEETAMLTSYEKYVNRRKSGSDLNYVNNYCYSYVLCNNLSTTANYSLNSYAKTGDRTEHLLAKLQEDFSDGAAGIKKGEILESVQEADYITLCIGANDLLKNATADFLIAAGNGNDNTFFTETYPNELNKCFNTFKTNFDKIIAILTANGQQVYVMSIYSPYKYFELENLPENQRETYALAGWFKYIYTKGLLRLNSETMKKLADINAYIKSVADKNSQVNFVDVANNFTGTSAIAKEEFPEYIHADPSKFDLGTVRNAGATGTVPIWFDPHPTIKGEAKIADLFKQVFCRQDG